MNSRYAFTLLAITLTGCMLHSTAQNALKFIEPNVTISYDSSVFKIADQNGNPFEAPKTARFVYIDKTAIEITPNRVTTKLDAGAADSLLTDAVQEMAREKMAGIAVMSTDTAIRKIDGFSCMGLTFYHASTKEYVTTIIGSHLSSVDYSTIRLWSPLKDRDSAYLVLNKLLEGFQSYSQETINQQTDALRNTCKVVVEPVKEGSPAFEFMPHTFTGVVYVTPSSKYKVKGVMLGDVAMSEFFEAEEDGRVFILDNDHREGTITRKGELIIVNSLGKSVRLPFSFSYVNKEGHN